MLKCKGMNRVIRYFLHFRMCICPCWVSLVAGHFFINLRTVCKEELKLVPTRFEKHAKIGKISLSMQSLIILKMNGH